MLSPHKIKHTGLRQGLGVSGYLVQRKINYFRTRSTQRFYYKLSPLTTCRPTAIRTVIIRFSMFKVYGLWVVEVCVCKGKFINMHAGQCWPLYASYFKILRGQPKLVRVRRRFYIQLACMLPLTHRRKPFAQDLTWIYEQYRHYVLKFTNW